MKCETKMAIMKAVSVVSAAVTTVTLIMVNAFGLTALTNVMSAATMIFICSTCYMIGVDDGRKAEMEDVMEILFNENKTEVAEDLTETEEQA